MQVAQQAGPVALLREWSKSQPNGQWKAKDATNFLISKGINKGTASALPYSYSRSLDNSMRTFQSPYGGAGGSHIGRKSPAAPTGKGGTKEDRRPPRSTMALDDEFIGSLVKAWQETGRLSFRFSHLMRVNDMHGAEMQRRMKKYLVKTSTGWHLKPDTVHLFEAKRQQLAKKRFDDYVGTPAEDNPYLTAFRNRDKPAEAQKVVETAGEMEVPTGSALKVSVSSEPLKIEIHASPIMFALTAISGFAAATAIFGAAISMGYVG